MAELERRRAVLQAKLDALDDDRRRTAYELANSGLSHGQIADALGVTKGRVWQMIRDHRAHLAAGDDAGADALGRAS